MNKYGSDYILEILLQHGITHVACNPGASFRGLHDSVVNSDRPESTIDFIVCCHEEISIAIAHGYAKASNKYMAVFVHANIGLLHASMAIFNAWCDRVPMLIIGGIGPLDTTQRRPWIDWIHNSHSIDSVILDYVKWSDQPYNLACVPESLYRAAKITNTDPKAPVYVAIDSSIQEQMLDAAPPLMEVNKFHPAIIATAPQKTILEVANLLKQAKCPVIIADYAGRNDAIVNVLVQLSELLSIPIIDRGGRYNFPTSHPLCLTGMEKDLYHQVDLIIALDVFDLYGALGEYQQNRYSSLISPEVPIVYVSLSDMLISKWGADFHRLYPVTMTLAVDSYAFISDLYDHCHAHQSQLDPIKLQERFTTLSHLHRSNRTHWKQLATEQESQLPLALPSVLNKIGEAIQDEKWILTNPGGVETSKWIKKLWDFTRTGSYLGDSGGAGLGYGLGASLGAALFYKNTDNLCIDIQADGDFLFTPSALWTAAHHQIPLLIIMMNNRAYLNSKQHAEKIAEQRHRKESNAFIGTTFTDPCINYPELAKSFGVHSMGTINTINEITNTILNAITYIKEHKKPVLVDIIIE